MEERLRRAKGVNFIYQAGILLDLPQLTLWVAGVFFHRFYMRYSMVEGKQGIHHYVSPRSRTEHVKRIDGTSRSQQYPPYQNIAATALFLANKTEENCRKTRELIVAVAKVAQKNSKLIIDEQSKEYWRWRDSILAYEELMLETLTFDLMVEHPYHRLYDQLVQLNLHHDKKVRDAAWTFCNDSCLTILPLLMEAREIAVSAIFFASASTGTKINDVNGRPWWETVGGNAEKMTKAATILADFIKENPLQKKQQPSYPGSPVFNLESTRRTGEVIEPIVYSQTDDGNASQNGTPMVATGSEDRGAVSQSPNKAAGSESQADVTQTVAGDVSQHPGDSDAGLKAAANDLDVHKGVSNGRGIRSPDGKRRALAEDIDAEDEGRASKRARTDEGDKDDEYTARD